MGTFQLPYYVFPIFDYYMNTSQDNYVIKELGSTIFLIRVEIARIF